MTHYDSKTMNQFTTIEFCDNLASGDALITCISESIKEIDNVKLIQLFKVRYWQSWGNKLGTRIEQSMNM